MKRNNILIARLSNPNIFDLKQPKAWAARDQIELSSKLRVYGGPMGIGALPSTDLHAEIDHIKGIAKSSDAPYILVAILVSQDKFDAIHDKAHYPDKVNADDYEAEYKQRCIDSDYRYKLTPADIIEVVGVAMLNKDHLVTAKYTFGEESKTEKRDRTLVDNVIKSINKSPVAVNEANDDLSESEDDDASSSQSRASSRSPSPTGSPRAVVSVLKDDANLDKEKEALLRKYKELEGTCELLQKEHYRDVTILDSNKTYIDKKIDEIRELKERLKLFEYAAEGAEINVPRLSAGIKLLRDELKKTQDQLATAEVDVDTFKALYVSLTPQEGHKGGATLPVMYTDNSSRSVETPIAKDTKDAKEKTLWSRFAMSLFVLTAVILVGITALSIAALTAGTGGILPVAIMGLSVTAAVAISATGYAFYKGDGAIKLPLMRTAGDLFKPKTNSKDVDMKVRHEVRSSPEAAMIPSSRDVSYSHDNKTTRTPSRRT